jgi:hypothetical protein
MRQFFFAKPISLSAAQSQGVKGARLIFASHQKRNLNLEMTKTATTMDGGRESDGERLRCPLYMESIKKGQLCIVGPIANVKQ